MPARLIRWILASAILMLVLGVAAYAARAADPARSLWSSPSAGAWIAAVGSPIAHNAEAPQPPICGALESDSPASYGGPGSADPFCAPPTTRSSLGYAAGKLRIHAASDNLATTRTRPIRSRSPPPHATR